MRTNSARRGIAAVGVVAATAAVAVGAVGVGAANSAAPQNTATPTVSGTPQEGQKLTGTRGSWSGSPTDYNYFWTRCDKTGNSCANISGATASTYLLTSADVGNTIRFKVQASSGTDSTFASSVPTAIVTAQGATTTGGTTTTPAPAATGCPKGSGPVSVNEVTKPARLQIDQQQSDPTVVLRSTSQLVIRYHVIDSCDQAVQGALVYATAVPFAQFTTPAEQATDANGWAEIVMRPVAGGFPVSSRQQVIAVFVRARKSGEDLLGGISTRRLFSLRVNLRG